MTTLPAWITIGGHVYADGPRGSRGEWAGHSLQTITGITKTRITLDDGSRWRASDLSSMEDPPPAQCRYTGINGPRLLRSVESVETAHLAGLIRDLWVSAEAAHRTPRDPAAITAVADAIKAIAPHLSLGLVDPAADVAGQDVFTLTD